MPEELKLLPCPACGTPPIMTGGISWHEQQEFWIKCKNKECGCCRVGDTVRENCVERWNALPRALTWTTEPPKVAGLFLWKFINDEGEQTTNNTLIEVKSLCIEYHKNARWAGPIPMPEESTL